MSCATSALESGSPLVLLGDFNAHLSTNDKRSEIFTQVIKECNLCTVSTSCIAQGPGYTFFSGELTTMVDYIFLDASLGCAVAKFHTHNYHNLNFSDHLPLSISLQLNAAAEVVFPPKVKINWPKSVERDLIYKYFLEVSNIVSQFLSLKDKSVAEINHEELFVSNAIVQAASKHLTAASRYKKKAYIKDEQLRKLYVKAGNRSVILTITRIPTRLIYTDFWQLQWNKAHLLYSYKNNILLLTIITFL